MNKGINMAEESCIAQVHIIQVGEVPDSEQAEEIRRQIEKSEKIMAHVRNMSQGELVEQITKARESCIKIFNEAVFALNVTTTKEEKGFNSTNLEKKLLQDMWLNLWSFHQSFQKENANLTNLFGSKSAL